MAAITTGNFTAGTGQYLLRASLAGSPNLQASHTFMVRLKNTQTSTTIDTVVAALDNNGLTTGNVIGRNSGIGTSAQMRWYRISTGGTADAGNRGTCYGNTTTWYHLAYVYNATTQMIRAYIDGVFIAEHSSLTTRTSSSTANTFLFGWHPGKYADAAIFNRALSDSEVEQMADYRVPQVTSGLLGFWRLDSNGNDSSGNSQTLSSGGSGTAVSYSTADNPPQPENPTIAIAGSTASSSAFTGALTNFRLLTGAAASSSAFAGALNTLKPIAGSAASSSALAGQLRAHIAGAASSSSALSAAITARIASNAASSSALAAALRPRWGRRVSAAGPNYLDRAATMAVPISGEWTLAGWYKSIATGGTNRIQLSGTGGTIRLGTLVGNFLLRYSDGANVINYTGTAEDTSWHHLAMTSDGTTVRAYFDGSQVASATPTLPGTNFTSLLIDAQSGGVAELAHIKLWTRQLSAAQLASEATYYTPHHYLANLVAWWQLSWQSPTLDSSGNSQTLTDNSSLEALFESPGAPLHLLAGPATSSSALSASLNTLKPIFGNATSQSLFSGTITVTLPLAGSAGSSSAFSANLTALVSGSGASASSFAASLTTLKPIAGDVASSSAFAAALTALLTGSASSTSALSGTLGQSLGVTGALGSSSALSAILGLQGEFGGVLQSSSALAATMFVQKPVAGAAASSSALVAAMVQDFAVASSLASASALGGALNVRLDVQGTLTTSSAFGGTLTVPLQIQGAMASVSALSATLGTAVQVSGALASGSAFAAQLTAQIAGNAASTSALSAQLRMLTPLLGNAASSSILAGNITVLSQRDLAGNAASVSQLLGALTVTVPAAASGTTVTDGIARAEYGPADIPSPRIPRRWPPRY